MILRAKYSRWTFGILSRLMFAGLLAMNGCSVPQTDRLRWPDQVFRAKAPDLRPFTGRLTPVPTGWYENADGKICEVPKPMALSTVIRGALLNALAYTDGHQEKAARLLGISSRSFCYQLLRHGIPTARTYGSRSFEGTHVILPQNNARVERRRVLREVV